MIAPAMAMAYRATAVKELVPKCLCQGGMQTLPVPAHSRRAKKQLAYTPALNSAQRMSKSKAIAHTPPRNMDRQECTAANKQEKTVTTTSGMKAYSGSTKQQAP
jgi:hypothetical protein